MAHLGYSNTRPSATLLALACPKSLLTTASAKSVAVDSPLLVISFPSITTLAPVTTSLSMLITDGWAVVRLSFKEGTSIQSGVYSDNMDRLIWCTIPLSTLASVGLQVKNPVQRTFSRTILGLLVVSLVSLIWLAVRLLMFLPIYLEQENFLRGKESNVFG